MASKINSRKGIIMTNKEKIIAIIFIISMSSVIVSAIYTFYQIKPSGYEFRIDRAFKNISNKITKFI